MAHSVTLTWTTSPDVPADSYNVYRGPAGAETTLLNTTPIPPPTGTIGQYIDSAPPAGVSSYVVRSVYNGVESVNSNEVTVTVPLQPPVGLTAVVN